MAVEKRNNKKEKKEDVVFQDEQTSEAPALEVEETEEVTKEVVEETMSKSSVRELMKEMRDSLKADFDKQLQSIKLSAAKKDLSDDKAYVDDLVEDWMDTPAIFFAFSTDFAIHGDKKKGKETTPPHGSIKFKKLIRSKRKGRKGTQVISVSSVKVQSKAEADYIRTHSQFGIKFFENVHDAMVADSGWAQKVAEANQSIQRLGDAQVIARCQMEGIPMGTDPDAMRKALVEVIAKKNIKRQEDMQYNKLKQANITVGDDGIPRDFKTGTIKND